MDNNVNEDEKTVPTRDDSVEERFLWPRVQQIWVDAVALLDSNLATWWP